MDSDLYALKGLFEMRKRVFYGSALVKKEALLDYGDSRKRY